MGKIKEKKTYKRIVLILIGITVLIIFFPYAKAEYLTLLHGDEFEGLEQQTNMLNDSRYFKILDYTKETATVFYVSDTGDLITFVRNGDGTWKCDTWKTIWSITGSADEFYWPYYRW